ncbi:M14 family metallopeptidase [Bacillus solitudinis]|uniref:M14 family metallopeptidase n=1 Tax=Bacillus solitudinis TaxID=2014074 RepID=UPI000C23A869|nr:M14 family metallopeptidase [Bacillus solitudinis]
MEVSVRQGDSLWYYSQLFQIPFRLVLDSNLALNPNQLAIGTRVQIPGYVLTTYLITSGETLWGISTKLGVPLDQIVLTNQQIQPQFLQIGQRIVIPQRIMTSFIGGQIIYDSSRLTRDLQQLAEAYPFIRREIIGYSVMGKPIEEIRIGYGTKRIHFNGSIHANEWITTPILMEFVNDYVRSITNRTAIRGLELNRFYQEVQLSVVPMINPDGVDVVINGAPSVEPYRRDVLAINQGREDFSGWKANIRGVDLNNQFPARWEEEALRKPSRPAPRDFPGYEPLSEPESIAIAELTRRRDFQRALAFHTQGKVIYWGFDGLEPPEAEEIVNEFSRVSNYLPIQYVDSYAGYKDWFIQEWRRPAYTVELGRGVNPLPLSQYQEIYQEALGIMLAGIYM